MQEVPAAVPYLNMYFLNPSFLLFPIVAEFYFSTHAPLSFGKARGMLFKGIEWLIEGAIATLSAYIYLHKNMIEFTEQGEN